jgi:hypothetical protein
MLAEFRAQDLQSSSSSSSSTISSSSSSSSNGNPTSSERANIPTTAKTGSLEEVSIYLILKACALGDVAQLRRWEHRGVRRQSVDILMANAGQRSSLDVLRYFVDELGTDVNGATRDGYTPLHSAAQYGQVD